MIQLLHGDCLALLPTLPAESVDSVVCDPPYGLGFMGKAWDTPGSFVERKPDRTVRFDKVGGNHNPTCSADASRTRAVEGRKFQAFCDAWAREVYRVLKPGGHLVAFGGSRTYHRMACAIEDAGFEIRDQIMWLYGCLDETAEILTAEGWKRGVDVQPGEMVAAWEPTSGHIELVPVQEKILAPFDGDLVAFRNDNTDQLLTPNHRVFKRHLRRKMTAGIRSCQFESEWTAQDAGEIDRYTPIKLPLAGHADGDGIGGVDYASLLGWIWTEGGFDRSGTGVRIYQSESANPEKVTEIDALVSSIVPGFKRYDRERTYTYGNLARAYTETCWFFSGEIARRVRADLPGKSPSWRLLWAMTRSEKEAFLDAAMKGDGSAMAFYQDDDRDLEWFQSLLHLTGRQGRINTAKRCVSTHDNPETELQSRHLRHAAEPYRGMVWCVRVSTGAFVARRNGRVFITGNSGFPKSLDVSKAIDKARVEDREPVRVVCRALRAAMDARGLKSHQLTAHFGDCHGRLIDHWAARDTDSQPALPTWEQWDALRALFPELVGLDAEVWRLNGRKGQPGENWDLREVVGSDTKARSTAGKSALPTVGGATVYETWDITAPATDAARQWAGFGTALKPSHEPICLARKKLDPRPITVVLTSEVLATWEAKRCGHA